MNEFKEELMKTLYERLNKCISLNDQCNKVFEECGEFIQAFAKYKPFKINNRENKMNLAEEIADLRIMLDWVEDMANIKEEIASLKYYKLKTLFHKIFSIQEISDMSLFGGYL